MLRRPATVITLTPEDLAAFEARSIQRIAANKAKAEQRLRDQKELQRRRREEQERAAREQDRDGGRTENVPSVGRSGRRRRGQDQEVESSGVGSVAGKAKVKGGRVYGGGLDMGMRVESSMVDGASNYAADPFGSALGSSPRRRQERQLEGDALQDQDGMEIDLDADVPDADGGVDLDADVPDMDADAGHDESASDDEEVSEGEEDVVLHTSNIDTSGIDVDMDTPTAPTRGHQQRPPIAAAARRPRVVPPPAPPPLTRPSRRTRTQQQPSRPMGYDGASDYPLPQTRLPQPPLFAQAQTRAAQSQPQPTALPSLLQAQAGRVPDPRYRRTAAHPSSAPSNHAPTYNDFNDNNDDDAETLEHEQYQPQHPQQTMNAQPQTQAETELQRRRRIQEETFQVAERERARRARIMGQAQARSQVGGTSQQVGSYGGVPGAPARSVVAARPATRR